MAAGRPKKIVAVSSGGGHWVQLQRLAPSFEGHRVVFVTVDDHYRSEVPANIGFYSVRDVSRWDRFGFLVVLSQLLRILLLERPDLVVSTGAAPGYIALRLGKLLGSRTVWVDSIANVDELSLSGRRIGKHADLWLTQWEHLARPAGPHFFGSVF